MTPVQGSASQYLSLWMRWTLKWNPASGSRKTLLLYLSERMIITHRRPGTSQLSSKVTQAWLSSSPGYKANPWMDMQRLDTVIAGYLFHQSHKGMKGKLVQGLE